MLVWSCTDQRVNGDRQVGWKHNWLNYSNIFSSICQVPVLAAFQTSSPPEARVLKFLLSNGHRWLLWIVQPQADVGLARQPPGVGTIHPVYRTGGFRNESFDDHGFLLCLWQMLTRDKTREEAKVTNLLWIPNSPSSMSRCDAAMKETQKNLYQLTFQSINTLQQPSSPSLLFSFKIRCQIWVTFVCTKCHLPQNQARRLINNIFLQKNSSGSEYEPVSRTNLAGCLFSCTGNNRTSIQHSTKHFQEGIKIIKSNGDGGKGRGQQGHGAGCGHDLNYCFHWAVLSRRNGFRKDYRKKIPQRLVSDRC